jgi:hypothetical protein
MTDKTDDRAKRLAAALRANLRKRKETGKVPQSGPGDLGAGGQTSAQ